MAEAVILLVVKKIGVALGTEAITQATSFFKELVTQMTEVQGSMGRIRRELRLMHEFLSGMDVRNRNNRKYEIWVEEVRMLVHRIEDMVDDYLHLVAHKHEIRWGSWMRKGFKRPNAVLSLNRMASSVKDAEANLVHLFQAKERWVSMVTSSESSSYIVEEDLVGVDENRNKLLEWLASGEMGREVITLHGMGGLGKTALAANVYRNEREKFECHAWVSISQTYSIKDILKHLVTELFRDDQKNAPPSIESMETEYLQDELKRFLTDRKYLIILDDVWAPEVVNELLRALVLNLKGSKVLVTTRVDSVAHLAFPDKMITLERLPEKESRELFYRTAFPRDEHNGDEQLTQLANKIVKKCKGVPLAIVSIGRLLLGRDKTEEEFRRIHDQLDWELINNPSLEHVRNILYLSYIYLPTSLKSCFLYLSLFPEDYDFKRKKIVRLWIAEGLIEKRGISTMEEVAEWYINEFIQRNMLQLVERNSFGRVKSFRMHDIVRELAVDLCRRECFGVAHSEEDRHEESLAEKNERRIVIHKLKDDAIQVISSAYRLRSLISFDNSMPSYTLLSLIATKCKYMSVLELSGLFIDKVPSAIGDLFNLQHLALRDSNVKLLPDSIEKLSNLLTLDLQGSQIKELPRGIVKLKRLRHLLAEKVSDKYWRNFRCRTGVHMPSGLHKLRELQTLQAVEARGEVSLMRLGALKHIRSIRIWGVKGSYCKALCESLRQMEFLSYLGITASDENEILYLNDLNPLPPNLQTLRLGGRLSQEDMLLGAPSARGQNNHSMYSVNLSWSQLEEDPLPFLSRWSNLAKLVLTNAYGGIDLVFLPGWFPSLKELSLRDMSLMWLSIHQGTMTSLQRLRLANLRKMIMVPTGIEFLLPTLKYLGFWEITNDFFNELRSCHRIHAIQWWYSLLGEEEEHLSEVWFPSDQEGEEQRPHPIVPPDTVEPDTQSEYSSFIEMEGEECNTPERNITTIASISPSDVGSRASPYSTPDRSTTRRSASGPRRWDGYESDSSIDVPR